MVHNDNLKLRRKFGRRVRSKLKELQDCGLILVAKCIN